MSLSLRFISGFECSYLYILLAVKCQTNLPSPVPRMLLWRNILAVKVKTAKSVILHFL